MIRIVDPDAPIHRILPVRRFNEILRERRFVMVEPTAWDDPYEVIGNELLVTRRGPDGYSQVVIKTPRVFAQCWSTESESDTLIRAYSRVTKDSQSRRNTAPDEEGVRVTSTARKLLRALAESASGSTGGSCFIGAVRYVSASALHQEIAEAIDRIGFNAFTNPLNRAQMLLSKRDAFAHENEVRLINVTHDDSPSHPTLAVSINPDETFDEIRFDPRLETAEQRERVEAARALGYRGRITESNLYQGVLLNIILDNDPRRDHA